MSEKRKCVKCDESVYASYKTKYYCINHLREVLKTEKESQNKVNQ